MLNRNSELDDIKQFLRDRIDQLYCEHPSIFGRKGKGISERSIVFGFANYLQTALQNDYFVDCDWNSSFQDKIIANGNPTIKEILGKLIPNEDGTKTKRFIDIIVHKRDSNSKNNFICLEIKKWNNTNLKGIKKDRNNLRVLTYDRRYNYVYGFHIILHKIKKKSKWVIFKKGIQNGEEIIFENQF